MHPEARKELRTRSKFVVLDYESCSGVTEACREFEVPRSTFYRWKKDMTKKISRGYTRRNPAPKRHSRMTPPEVVEKILKIRKEY